MSDPVSASAPPPPAHLQLERLEIVDGAGRPRIVLGGMGPADAPSLVMYDETGRERVTIGIYDSGPQLSFLLNGFGVVEMGVADPDDPEVDVPGAFLYIIEYEGDVIHGWRAGDPSWRPASPR